MPGVLALLPEYASLTDPVAELRQACREVVGWLAEQGPVAVVADAQGARVAAQLLAEAGLVADGGDGGSPGAGAMPDGGDGGSPGAGVISTSSKQRSTDARRWRSSLLDQRSGPLLDQRSEAVLVVANGTARRGEKAPGHLDERAGAYDEAIGAALRGPDPATLAGLDEELGAELLAGNVAGLRTLGELLTPAHRAEVAYDADPFGVQYWVVRWTCGS